MKAAYILLAFLFLAGLPGVIGLAACDFSGFTAVTQTRPCTEETPVSPAPPAKTAACDCGLMYLPANLLLTAVSSFTFLSLGLILGWETAVTIPPTPPPR
ncbi:MAG: hypothetical protein HF973_12190 [Chloroflexi bacterium]|nr:hypothetical protein [Chloroflexota bacterium]